jgi:hypothetical protein
MFVICPFLAFISALVEQPYPLYSLPPTFQDYSDVDVGCNPSS